MTELICKHCGKTIQVPEELETFSCVFCGEKMRREDFLAPVGTSDEEDRRFVLENLLTTIREHPDYGLKNFTRRMYEQTYKDYKEMCRGVYEAMDRYVLANPDRRQALLEEFTDRFLEDWEAMRKDRKGERRAFSDKMTLALYEIPVIRGLELSVSEDYVALLHEKFVAAYPKNAFLPGTYAEISAGFRKRKWCFITTAVCEFEGKPDDCAELTAFRGFRDGWLTEHGGAGLIAEYYEIAPAIVAAIDFCDDRAERYAALRRDYLTPCFEALRRGENAACRDTYVRMVRDLRQTYGLN